MYKDHEFYMRLGYAIKAQRRKNKLTAREVAKIMAVSSQQFTKYESGENRIPVDKLDKFCKELNIDAQYLIDLSNKVQVLG